MSLHVCVDTCGHISLCLNACAYIQTCSYVYMCVCICMCGCIYSCVHTYMSLHTYLCMHTHQNVCLTPPHWFQFTGKPHWYIMISPPGILRFHHLCFQIFFIWIPEETFFFGTLTFGVSSLKCKLGVGKLSLNSRFTESQIKLLAVPPSMTPVWKQLSLYDALCPARLCQRQGCLLSLPDSSPPPPTRSLPPSLLFVLTGFVH